MAFRNYILLFSLVVSTIAGKFMFNIKVVVLMQIFFNLLIKI